MASYMSSLDMSLDDILAQKNTVCQLALCLFVAEKLGNGRSCLPYAKILGFTIAE